MSVSEMAAVSGAGARVSPADAAGAQTLLVVDDEPGIVDSLQKIFEREHLRVLTAASGRQP